MHTGVHTGASLDGVYLGLQGGYAVSFSRNHKQSKAAAPMCAPTSGVSLVLGMPVSSIPATLVATGWYHIVAAVCIAP